MAHYNTVLNQLLSLVPRHDFDSLVRQFQGDRYVKRFSTWNQFTVLLFAQASGKGSLRDIQNSFAAEAAHLYHLGLPDSIARSTISDANASRDYRIYERLFYQLQDRCRSMAPKHQFKFKNPLFSLDSTTIELCLTSFPWAKHSKLRGAIKLHYGIDHAGNIPVFLNVTKASCSDVVFAGSHWNIIPDSIVCVDKGYIDFDWFRRIDEKNAYFVTRAKDNFAYKVIGQQKVPRGTGVLFDKSVTLIWRKSIEKFSKPLRLIGYRDKETGRCFEFLTNNFALSAATIARIYKARWQIEAFFKWIKQNLKIKAFLGTSRNAVLTQIWAAMCYLLILAYIKFQAKYDFSLFYLHRVIGQTILTRLSILDLLHLNTRRLAQIKLQERQLCFQL